MTERPYTLLSCSVSLDGYLGGPSSERLILSNEADLDRVDQTRAGCDAIMVGAATVRQDNPRLLVRDHSRRLDRTERGLPPQPVKVTVTRCGRLDPDSAFFTAGDAPKLVYCTSESAPVVRNRLHGLATVVDAGEPVRMGRLSEDLHERGVRRLMVEGGGTLHTQFLTDGLADELQLVVAPFFVGDHRASRFVGDGRFPWHCTQRARLVEVRRIGDVALLRYALSDRYEEQVSWR
ncbi:MAG TPA: dihydrofolate reductase family protein [Marmoricola sp.]|jgi:5-amino-6-(5-phosphoribosylamino)uracil reductase|nr:dihydrofolate reductase family protein [Marmoricola sp.]